LRYSGRLTNLNIDKVYLEKFIKDLWAQRQLEWCSNAGQGGSVVIRRRKQTGDIRMLINAARRDPEFARFARMDYSNVPCGVTCHRQFPDYLNYFINDHHRSQAGEMAYSLMDACARFKYDADVELFHRILVGDVPEDAYYDQMVMVEKFRMLLVETEYRSAGEEDYDWVLNEEGRRQNEESRRQSLSQNDSPTSPAETASPRRRVGPNGKLQAKQILENIQMFFPAKAEAHYFQLRIALCDQVGLRHIRQQGTEEELQQGLEQTEVKYVDLFQSDAKGNQGAFMEVLRDQYVEELMVHTTETLQCIQAADGVKCPEGYALLKVIKFQLLVIDEKPEREVNRWLWLLVSDSKQQFPGHGSVAAELKWDEHYEVSKLSERGRRLLCKRYGPRPADVRSRAFELVEQLDLPDSVAEALVSEESGLKELSVTPRGREYSFFSAATSKSNSPTPTPREEV